MARRTTLTAFFFGPILALLLPLLLSAVPLGAASAQAEAPAARGWAGTWLTRWRGGGATLELEERGDGRVTGRYPLYEGAVDGRGEGDRLAGTWTEPTGGGEFTFLLAPDGASFMGRFANGEWWTGRRADAAALRASAHAVDLSSPRGALQTFTVAANRYRAGDYDAIGAGLEALDFGADGWGLRTGERLERATALFRVLDQLTFRVWDAPGPVPAVTLRQAGTGLAFEVPFRNSPDGWHILVPPQPELDARLKELLARRGGAVPGPQDHLRLGDPRATMRAFLEGLPRWDEGGREQVLSAMDLSRVGERIRDVEGELLAQYLKQVLDRIGYVIWQEIPDDPARRAPYVHFEHPAGNIVIEPEDEDGRTVWRFSADTLESLRDLFGVTEQLPPMAAGVAPVATFEAGAELPFFFRLRQRIYDTAPALIQRTGALENWQWLGVGLVYLAGVLVGLGLTRFALVVLRRRFKNRGATLDRRIEVALLWPAWILFSGLVWYAGVAALGLPVSVSDPLQAFDKVAIAVGGVWSAYVAVDLLSAFLHARSVRGDRRYLDEILVSLVAGALKIVVVAVGAMLLADALSLPYQNVLAGLGIGGLAIAIAAQGTISNLFGAATLMTDRPFRRGDLVTVGGTTGTVEAMGLRSTRIRTADDSLVVIPNSKLVDETISNLGQRRQRMFKARLSLVYDTPPSLIDAFARRVRDLVDARADTARGRTTVGLVELGPSSIDLELACYFDTSAWVDENTSRHGLILALVRLAEEMRVEFAFPTQTTHVRAGNVDEVRALEAQVERRLVAHGT